MIDSRIPFRAKGLALSAVMAAFASEAWSGPRFQLMAETWINQTGGGQSGTFTAHTYDGSGKRIRTEIFIGLDGSGDIFEKREFIYFADGLLDAQANYYGADLESRIVHRYDAVGRLSTKSVQGEDGVERFRDDYAYDDLGRVATETRIKGETTSSMHKLGYASDGSVASDSLFEPEGSSLFPVQAALHGPGRTPAERREARWRKQDGAWYHVQDTFRLYKDGFLVSAAAYQVGGRRLDSSAFAYDADGNRVLEERFTGAGLPLSRLILQWKDLQAISIRRHAAFGKGSARPPLLLLGGPSGTGWNHAGLDLLGRPRPQALAAQGSRE